MAELYYKDPGDQSGEHVNSEHPLPVKIIDSSPPAASFVTTSHTVITVTTDSQLALSANPSRKYALFMNDSDTAMYLAIDTTAVSNTGIRLSANGGSYEMSRKNDNLVKEAVYVIGGATKTLLITEGV